MSEESGKNGENGNSGFGLLLDSDIFIDLLRGFEPARDYIKKLIKSEENVFFSAITETELLAGSECNDPQKKDHALHILFPFKKIIIENKIAQMAGDLRRKYSHLQVPDAVIAACAILTKSTVVTKNIKDFEKITEIKSNKPY